jgi:hypothetical protein
VALLSAAGVIAATGTTAGVLLNQPKAPAAAQVASESVVMKAVIPNADTALPTPAPAASATAPTQPASAPQSAAPAAPSVAAPAAPAPAAPPAPSEKVLDLSFEYQPNYYYCGPAAVHNALTARGVNLSQDELATRLGTTANGTDSAEDTTRALNSVVGAGVYRTRVIAGQDATPAEIDQLQADVVHAMSNGYGIVANIAGSSTDEAGVLHDFPGGHYIALVGYSSDGRSVMVADSSGMFGPSTYWMSTINMANWIGTRGYSA